jgi:hypothetical protein
MIDMFGGKAIAWTCIKIHHHLESRCCANCPAQLKSFALFSKYHEPLFRCTDISVKEYLGLKRHQFSVSKPVSMFVNSIESKVRPTLPSSRQVFQSLTMRLGRRHLLDGAAPFLPPILQRNLLQLRKFLSSLMEQNN